MAIDISRVVITLINFCILYFVLRHFLFKPVTETVEAREDEIKTRISKSEEDQKKAELLRLENEKELLNAKTTGKTIVEEYKVKAQALSDEIMGKASKDAQGLVEKGKAEVLREKEKVSYELKEQVVDLAVMLSSKVLDDNIDEAQHRKLIQDFIAKVGI